MLEIAVTLASGDLRLAGNGDSFGAIPGSGVRPCG